MPNYNFRWRFLGGMCELIRDFWQDNFETACEWGPGYSTFILNALLHTGKLKTLISTEQYKPYYDEVVKNVAAGPGYYPILAELIEVDRLNRDSANSLFYTTAPLSFARPVDFAFVDGRGRSECLFVAALASSPDAIFVLDDSERLRYLAALTLFDEVGRYLRFTVLKLKPVLQQYFRDFSQQLIRFAECTVVSPKARKEGMTHVPVLPTLTPTEVEDLKSLLRMTGNTPGHIVCWGNDDIADIVGGELRPDKKAYLQVCDSNSISGNHNFMRNRYRVSLTGSLNDESRDPHRHYSTTPVIAERLYRTAIVAGHRRNECMLTIAYILEEGGNVVLRDGQALHHAVGLEFFEKIEQMGSWTLARPKQKNGAVFRGLREELWDRAERSGVTEL